MFIDRRSHLTFKCCTSDLILLHADTRIHSLLCRKPHFVLTEQPDGLPGHTTATASQTVSQTYSAQSCAPKLSPTLLSLCLLILQLVIVLFICFCIIVIAFTFVVANSAWICFCLFALLLLLPRNVASPVLVLLWFPAPDRCVAIFIKIVCLSVVLYVCTYVPYINYSVYFEAYNFRRYRCSRRCCKRRNQLIIKIDFFQVTVKIVCCCCCFFVIVPVVHLPLCRHIRLLSVIRLIQLKLIFVYLKIATFNPVCCFSSAYYSANFSHLCFGNESK